MTEKKRNAYGLTQRNMATIWSAFENYPEVKTVHLFGSRAKGNYRLGSDIDLAIVNEGVSAKSLAKLKSDFEDSSLPYNVDLVDFNRLDNKGFIDHIKQVGIPFFKRSEQLKGRDSITSSDGILGRSRPGALTIAVWRSVDERVSFPTAKCVSYNDFWRHKA